MRVTQETTDRHIVTWIREKKNVIPNMSDVELGHFLTNVHNEIMEKQLTIPESFSFEFEYNDEIYKLTITAFMTNPDLELKHF